MFSLGMSYRDIRGHVENMYGIDVSEATITGVTDRLIPELKEWRQRSRLAQIDELAEQALAKLGPDAKMNVSLERCPLRGK